MIFLFPLLLLLFGSVTTSAEHHVDSPLVTPSNASSTVIHCPVAENFIQTHMAPYFESPQLVRRLDWFHDDALVASYQQNVVADTSRQWWVADSRFQLQRPFYSLRLAPVNPEDAGIYRCRLETDPLFALSITTSHVELNVMVRPPPPSSPEIKAISNRSVTLSWNHNTAKAHRPIQRYSVGVRLLSDDSRFVIPAPSNATSVIVDNLSPYSLYAFAVRAENAAGHSDFGPETKQRTFGEAPTTPPRLVAVTNASEGCVAMTVDPPTGMHGELRAYLVTLAAEMMKPTTERFGRGKGPLTICNLLPHTAYTVSVLADTEFGISPPIQHSFHTDLAVPQSAPIDVSVVAEIGSPRLVVRWKPPRGNEPVTQYNVYHKASGHSKWKVERLTLNSQRASTFKHEIVSLVPRTRYSIRVSASSAKGEGPRSEEMFSTTDVSIPAAIELEKVSFDCQQGVHLQWPTSPGRPGYRVEVSSLTKTLSFNTTRNELDIGQLSLHEEYSVRVAAVVRSIVDNTTLLKGPWGMEQRFVLSNNCQYHSSLCSAGAKCQPLVAAVPARSFPVLAAVIAVSLFVLLCFIVILFLKGRCIDVKTLLKKKEKCVYLDELTPLVYDSTGIDDIPVELFYGYCEDLARNNSAKYKLQFEQIEQMTSSDASEPDELEKNLDKNRYLNIGAIDSSRVRLHSSESDYINASWIDSCEKRNAYIATQAPLPSTFSDFWAMVWQERVNVIVVITNLVEDGRRKCDPYWPSSTTSPQTHGNHQVALVSETTNAYFTHRVLNIKIAKCVPPTERRVHQLHFTGWPDHGVPDSVFPLLNFMHFVSDIHSTGPVVVHCSAGVGRSGSFILVDSMRRHLINQRKLNLMGHLVHMRRQREKLVQTVEQYIFCHEAVRQLIRHGITRVHADLFQRYLDYLAEENVNNKTRLQMQYEDLCECPHRPSCPLPSDYAVLPGYHRLDEFIVASWPQENEQLWELVWRRSCQTIVLIGDSSYWQRLERVGEMTIQHGDHFALLNNNEDQLCVKIVDVATTSLENNFWEEVERLQRERLVYHDAPLLILYPLNSGRMSSSLRSDGYCSPNGTALSQTLSLPCLSVTSSPSLAFCMCALTSLACQLESTGCMDVVSVLSSYHRLHCGIWQSLQDVEFIYDQLTALVGGSRTQRTTAKPQRTTAKPQRTTAKPQRTTAKPQRTTAKPQRTTAKPQRTTAKPQRTTVKPQRTTAKSQRTTAKPQRTTAKPQLRMKWSFHRIATAAASFFFCSMNTSIVSSTVGYDHLLQIFAMFPEHCFL